MLMESISGDEYEHISDGQESTAQEEKIYVAVRLRPLNEKEIARNDASDWECINNTTIVFKNNQSERPTNPNLYTFDRVYGCDSLTKQVYEEGVKGIALSVLNGINSSIFAYGQTSSGKTYTMSGITEYAIADIYDYISKQNDREFVLKFSAIEIYNECVRDLLSIDGAPLRLLDDPEKGTVVEKLTEANLRDRNHLKELIYLCEAERQIGETALNEMSSRSHQILRLTVESSTREYRGVDSGRTLSATVNFVDLAGSERASQTLAAGTRLKEGCHINRSLLTLGTVIRKLSKRGGHIPYRNSKLTRILQNSLGGNARTAILCTMCPAHSHVEQSRNTLLFASCAKDVQTNAQVNVVMSDKALVKQLQQELARLETELRASPASNESTSLIRNMELQLQKMEKEIEELTQQRDLAQTRLEHLIQLTGIDRNSLPWEESSHLNKIDEYRFGGSSKKYRHSSMDDFKNFYADDHILDENSPLKFLDQYSVPDPYQESEKISHEMTMNLESCKEDRPIHEKTSNIDNNFTIDSQDNFDKIRFNSEDRREEDRSIGNHIILNPERSGDDNIVIDPEDSGEEDDEDNRKEDRREKTLIVDGEDRHIEKTPSIDDKIIVEEAQIDDNYDDLKEKIDDIDGTKSYHEERSPCSSDTDISESDDIGFTRSKSCKEFTTTENEMTNDEGSEREFSGKKEGHKPKSKSEADVKTVVSRQDSDTSVKNIGEKEIVQKKIKSSTEGDVSDRSPTVKSLSELISSDPEVVSTDKKVQEIEPKANISREANNDVVARDEDWPTVFEKQRRDIIKLWDECNTPLIHRTYFFLLFKGDQSDSVYMEVELRRLTFLKKTPYHVTSARALIRERLTLSKKLLKKFTPTQRDGLFQKWGIPLDSKHRRVQLSRLLWTKTDDLDHIKDSAEIVANMVGIVELNKTPKELFGLSFLPKPDIYKTSFWKASMSFT